MPDLLKPTIVLNKYFVWTTDRDINDQIIVNASRYEVKGGDLTFFDWNESTRKTTETELFVAGTWTRVKLVESAQTAPQVIENLSTDLLNDKYIDITAEGKIVSRIVMSVELYKRYCQICRSSHTNVGVGGAVYTFRNVTVVFDKNVPAGEIHFDLSDGTFDRMTNIGIS